MNTAHDVMRGLMQHLFGLPAPDFAHPEIALDLLRLLHQNKSDASGIDRFFDDTTVGNTPHEALHEYLK